MKGADGEVRGGKVVEYRRSEGAGGMNDLIKVLLGYEILFL